MDNGLSFSALAALFGAMALLAAVPSVSVLAVSARSATSGFRHGAATALGVVGGDAVLIVVAVFGLVLLADLLNQWFVLVMLAGGSYLIWLGIGFWRTRPRDATSREGVSQSLPASFAAGLMITLGDQKALVFYLGFFPAFVDLQSLTGREVVLILAAALLAVGGVKLIYAWLAHRSGQLLSPRLGEGLNRLAAAVLWCAGILLLWRALLSLGELS